MAVWLERTHGIELLFVLPGVVAMIVIAALFVVALVQIMRRPLLTPLLRLGWVVALIAFPALGSIAWFAIGDKTPQLACLPRR